MSKAQGLLIENELGQKPAKIWEVGKPGSPFENGKRQVGYFESKERVFAREWMPEKQMTRGAQPVIAELLESFFVLRSHDFRLSIVMSFRLKL